jgi:phage shock protein E
MSNLLTGLFGKPADLKAIHQNGAIILDVRSPEEFNTGHIEGAINIPVDQVNQRISDLRKKGRPIITCCRSGARSGMAKATLAAAGLEVYNGGPWHSLQKQVK